MGAVFVIFILLVLTGGLATFGLRGGLATLVLIGKARKRAGSWRRPASAQPKPGDPHYLDWANREGRFADRPESVLVRESHESPGPAGSVPRGDSVLERDALEVCSAPPTPQRRYNNVIARHWRGEFSLPVSYWVIGVLGGMLVGDFGTLVGAALPASNGYDPVRIFAFMVTLWTGVTLFVVWQLVGIWRSASRYRQQKMRRLWGGLAKGAMILSALQSIIAFLNSGLPQLTEISKMAFMGDPDLPDYAIRIMRDGTEVEVSGGIKYGLDSDLIRILNAAPRVKVLHLNSNGGRAGEAMKLHSTIRSRNLMTYVSDTCASACTLAFAAGRERWLHPRAQLGFHASTFPGMSARDLSEAMGAQRALMIASGIAPDFVSRALSTPNSSMWEPTPEELLRARVITAVADRYRFAFSGIGNIVSRAELGDRLKQGIPFYAALETKNPDIYSKIVEDFSNGYLAGVTEGHLFDALRARVLPIVRSYRAFADDSTMLEVGRLFVEQLRVLATRDKTICYEYASGTGGSRNYSEYFSSALVQQELTVSERILRTATLRPKLSDEALEPYWQKIGAQLISRFGEKVQLLAGTNLRPSQQADYCDLSIAMYQEILRSPEHEAVMLIRANFQE